MQESGNGRAMFIGGILWSCAAWPGAHALALGDACGGDAAERRAPGCGRGAASPRRSLAVAPVDSRLGWINATVR